MPGSYNRAFGFYMLFLTGVVAFGLGARGWLLAVSVLVGFFPMAMLGTLVAMRVLPPTLVFSDEYLEDIRGRK